MTSTPDLPDFARHYPNLAVARLGCAVRAASDEFFADKSRMISEAAPVFIPDKFDDNGKWMDGWETRRRREGGNDWCILQLGQEAEIMGVDIDTSHFTGNYPPEAMLEVGMGEGDDMDAVTWQPFIARMELQGDSHHYIPTPPTRARWLRLSIYPDGGIARLRVHGQVMSGLAAGEEADLAAVVNGGRVIAVSDSHFGAPDNMLMPGKGVNMGDGWETRRLRGPGNDWAVIALGSPGTINRLIVDTAYFKGNYPAAFSMQGVYAPDLPDADCVAASASWQPLYPKTPLSADNEHEFREGIVMTEAVTHVRLDIFPDGGISRLRLFGVTAEK